MLAAALEITSHLYAYLPQRALDPSEVVIVIQIKGLVIDIIHAEFQLLHFLKVVVHNKFLAEVGVLAVLDPLRAIQLHKQGSQALNDRSEPRLPPHSCSATLPTTAGRAWGSVTNQAAAARPASSSPSQRAAPGSDVTVREHSEHCGGRRLAKRCAPG